MSLVGQSIHRSKEGDADHFNGRDTNSFSPKVLRVGLSGSFHGSASRSHLPTTSSFSSFLSDLPPQEVVRLAVRVKGFGVVPPNFKKPLMPVPPELPCASVDSQIVDEGKDMVLVDLAAIGSPHLSLTQRIDLGNPISPSSIGSLHIDGIPTPIPEGVGNSQGPILSIPLEGPAPPFSRQLVPREVSPSRSSSDNLNNSVAKNILSRGKILGFNFTLREAYEEARLEFLEERDRVAKESRMGVR
jgi:hypothetical protein